MSLRVERWGLGYAVFDGKKRVSGVYNQRDYALSRMDKIEIERRQAGRARKRPCLTCGSEFWSEGHGNRMCPRCRWQASGTDAQMAG